MTTDPEHPNYYFDCERWWKDRVGILYMSKHSTAKWHDFDWRHLVIAYHTVSQTEKFYAEHGETFRITHSPSTDWNTQEQCEYIITKWIQYCDTQTE